MTTYNKNYFSTQVATANPRQLVVYLYDAALSHVQMAHSAVESRNYAASARHTNQAIDILIELSGALDFSHDPEFALRLMGLYNHLIESLSIAQLRNDAKAYRAAEGVISTLGAGWRHAMKNGATPRRQTESEAEAGRKPLKLSA